MVDLRVRVGSFGRSTIGAVAEQLTSLQFPANTGNTADTVRFSLAGANWAGSSPFTMLWNYYPFGQPSAPNETGYNTTFFHGSTDSPFQNTHQYVGCHPYPENFGAGPNRNWEISAEGFDDIADENSNSTLVTGNVNRWYRQALVVTSTGGNAVRWDFYWDIAAGFTRLISRASDASFLTKSTGSAPATTFGDAPWNPGNEMMNGRIRAIQMFQASLNTTQLGTLSACNYDAAALSAASGLGLSHWYLKMNPTVANINDASGNGRNPTWLNSNRPTDYSENP